MAASVSEGGCCVDNLIQTLGDNLRRRAGRKEFWVGFLLVVMANAVLGYALGMVGIPSVWSGLLTLPVWLYYAGRRLHDLGLTAWLGLIPFGAGVLTGVLTALLPLEPQTEAMAANVVSMVIALVILLWLGCVKGQDGANRFGLPPGVSEPADAF
jgi:uncharacterized membrane protein YhaH (DUF805 family)